MQQTGPFYPFDYSARMQKIGVCDEVIGGVIRAAFLFPRRMNPKALPKAPRLLLTRNLFTPRLTRDPMGSHPLRGERITEQIWMNESRDNYSVRAPC